MPAWIGTSGFQYPEWKGTFYPEKLSLARMLPFYSGQFNTTEINYSFRRIPSLKTIDGWLNNTPDCFRFSLKAPQKITHFAKLRDCAETLAYFHQVISGLGAKLGPVLFQLPPSFTKDAPGLLSFLQTLPRGMRAAFEFRHPSWFDDEIFAYLETYRAALCIAESAELTTPRIAMADFGYLRLRREDYTHEDLSRWAGFVRTQKTQWREVFIYLKHEESGVGPRFAKELIGMLG